MVGDYISREAALTVLDWDCASRDALNAIKAIPAANVVEVVRCRECKYRAEDDFCTGRGWPDQLVADDGFCEKGKRKDGGQHE